MCVCWAYNVSILYTALSSTSFYFIDIFYNFTYSSSCFFTILTELYIGRWGSFGVIKKSWHAPWKPEFGSVNFWAGLSTPTFLSGSQSLWRTPVQYWLPLLWHLPFTGLPWQGEFREWDWQARPLSQEGVSKHSWKGVGFQSLLHSVAPCSKASVVPWEIWTLAAQRPGNLIRAARESILVPEKSTGHSVFLQ